MTDTAPALQELVDERAVIRIVDAIDIAVDNKDWQTCRSYFMDEIEVDFVSLAGGEPGRIPADTLIEGWRTSLYQDKQSLHLRTNHQVTLDGDQAEVLSHGYAYNMLRIGNGSDLWEVWGIYRHRLQRTTDGWRVSAMAFNATYARGNEKVREYLPQS